MALPGCGYAGCRCQLKLFDHHAQIVYDSSSQIAGHGVVEHRGVAWDGRYFVCGR